MKLEGPEIQPKPEQTKDVLYEVLRAELTIEALELRKYGFDVDDDGRIKPDAFTGIFKESDIADDNFAVSDLERKFKIDGTQATKESQLLEMAILIGFNRHWFNKEFVAVRTAKLDDYTKTAGADMIIFHKATGQALAAIDTTVNPQSKAKGLQETIRFGPLIKYAYTFKESRATKKARRYFPLFLISVKTSELAKMIGDYKKFEQNILKSLKDQCAIFPQFPKMSTDRKEDYGEIKKILETIKL